MIKKYRIERDYYKHCLKTADKIESFVIETMKDKELLDEIVKTNGLEAIDTDLFGDYNSRVVIIVLRDIWKCYDGMGFNSDDLEAQSMLCYSMAFFNMGKGNSKSRLSNGILAEDIRELKEFQVAGSHFMKFMAMLEPAGFEEPTAFLMSMFYDRLGRDKRKYLNFLYEVSGCMASAEDFLSKKAKRYLDKIKPEEEQPAEDEELNLDQESATKGIEDLDELIGLGNVKSEIKKLNSFVQVQQWRIKEGLKLPVVSYHCVFTGNPGTGKTTVARILAKIFKELGLLKKGHLIETDRSGLVAEYVGQTAVKTNKIIDSALDGVLFIDEAYSLVTEGTGEFGHEAIATLLKRMEDNRDRLVVILAGYGEEMKNFIESNPGLKSRFNRYFHFEDYSASELWDIFQLLLKKNEYTLDADAETKIRQILDNAIQNRDRHFGNARYVRNLFEKILENQAMRLAATGSSDRESLQKITASDITQSV